MIAFAAKYSVVGIVFILLGLSTVRQATDLADVNDAIFSKILRRSGAPAIFGSRVYRAVGYLLMAVGVLVLICSFVM